MDIRIEAAEKLGKCDGIEDAPWRLVEREGEVFSEELERPQVSNMKPLPWLRIEDKNPWSSAAILARAGYVLLSAGLEKRMLVTLDEWIDILKNGVILDKQYQAIDVKKGEDETANILGICKLYEIDRDAYYKGMRPLMDEELQGIKVERPVNL